MPLCTGTVAVSVADMLVVAAIGNTRAWLGSVRCPNTVQELCNLIISERIKCLCSQNPEWEPHENNVVWGAQIPGPVSRRARIQISKTCVSLKFRLESNKEEEGEEDLAWKRQVLKCFSSSPLYYSRA